jgi:SAM-dependent methyltransferase
VLLPEEDTLRFVQFGNTYREARLKAGWRPLTPKQILALPFGAPPGYPALYWEVRRQSYEGLMRFLEEEGPRSRTGPVADLGAGVGWLSYRLAQKGYYVVAVEASLDEAFGLSAAEPYFATGVDFLPVQGNLEYPPLLNGRLALIVFNASLHYAWDLEGTLQRAAHCLRPGGRLIVLDTPISVQPELGSGQGDRHLGREELRRALLDAGLRPRWVAVRRSPRWWFYQAKKWLKREPLFSFPMVVADSR